jgi:hypothetical protein
MSIEEQSVKVTSYSSSPLGDVLDSLMDSYKQLLEATLALNVSGVPYAVCGGFAVSMWSLHHDIEEIENSQQGRPRARKPLTLVNTRDVDILVRRSDLDTVSNALSRAGFSRVSEARNPGYLRNSAYRSVSRRNLIREYVDRGIHLLFAGEKNHEDTPFENPDPTASTSFSDVFWGSDYVFRIVNLEPLLLMKLCSVSPQRVKDLLHIVELWESNAITDELVERIAFDARWFDGDHLNRFHRKFQETIDTCLQHGMRRYAMAGDQVKRQFDQLIGVPHEKWTRS